MNLAGMIDHTMLKADAPRDVIVRYCEEAKQYGFASVCVNSCRVPLVAQQLQGSDVKVCCVVGFPLGAMLTDEEKIKACELSVAAGADFVKTSTGFSTGGATVEDVALMKKTVDGKALVKASGGIRTNADALRMSEAGADRIGVGNGVPLLGA